jgi:predicted DNA-binding protein
VTSPMTNSAIRHQLYLSPDVTKRLEALAAKPGATKSAILADAVTAWINRRGASELDEKFAVRLDRMSNQLARIERDGQIMLESLALFIHYQLSVCAPLADGDTAARAVARDRFNAFVTQVGRQIASGKRTLDRVAGEGAVQ